MQNHNLEHHINTGVGGIGLLKDSFGLGRVPSQKGKVTSEKK